MGAALVAKLSPLLRDESSAVREAVLSELQCFAQLHPLPASQANLAAVIPTLLGGVGGVGDSNSPVRKAAQQALYHLLNFHVSKEAANAAVEAVAKKLSATDSGAAASLIDYCKRTLSKLHCETRTIRSVVDFAEAAQSEEDNVV